MKFITGVIVTGIQNMAAATGFSGFVRLEGPGMVNGPQTLATCAGGNAVATGGNFEPNIDPMLQQATMSIDYIRYYTKDGQGKLYKRK